MESKFLRTCLKKLSNDPSWTKISQEQRTLLWLSKSLRDTNQRSASGRCFGSCLTLGREAEKREIPLKLIRWKVLNDKDYADHWAVRFNETFTIDLTSVQFDKSGEVLQKVSAYPQNFSSMREYPFEIFSEIYQKEPDPQKFSSKTMWDFYKAMLFYDLRSVQQKKALMSTSIELMDRIKECIPLIVYSVNEWANGRLVSINNRVNLQIESVEKTLGI